MIGRTLGHYRIIALLGEGGMGSVWRAHDSALNHDVAIKVLSASLLTSEGGRQRLLREARAASRLKHPGIAFVYDVGESDGEAWIVQELIEGRSVAKLCEQGKLPLADAAGIALGVAEALEHAHSRGVLHRDVTARNIMVTPQGRAVLVDFGLARPTGEVTLTNPGEIFGTPGYMAPEFLRGQPADARSDLYGLGVVLHRMITGRMPFESAADDATTGHPLTDRVPPPSKLRPDLPVGLERVVLRLLERDPEDRFASASEVAGALRRLSISKGPTIVDRRPSVLGRRWGLAIESVRRNVGRRSWRSAVAAVALLAGALWLAVGRGWHLGIATGPQVLAVLPFENASAETEEAAYLGEGLGHELAARLGETGTYRVLPWASTRGLEGTAKRSLVQIARDLHASALLVGSFRADSDRIRVTASLVDGKTGVQRWSQAFDERVTDLMSVQVNIALGVASRLEGALAPDERAALGRRPSNSPEAYDLYLRGATAFQSDDPADRSLAELYFRKALDLDTALAEAHVGLGALHNDAYFRGHPGGRVRLSLAREEFERALALRPRTPRAERGLVLVHYERGEVEPMLRLAEQVAKRGDRSPEDLMTRGCALMLANLPGEAIPVFARVMQIDPMSQEAAWYLVISLAWNGDFDRAISAGRAFVRRFGEDPEVYIWMALSASSLGRMDEALTLIDRALELFGESESNLYVTVYACGIYMRAGAQEKMQALLRHWIPLLEARRRASPDNFRVLSVEASLRALAGDREGALKIIDMMESIARGESTPLAMTTTYLLHATLIVGEAARTDRVIQLARREDLANLEVGFRILGPILEPRGGLRTLEHSEGGRRLIQDVRERSAGLRARYGPTVGVSASRHAAVR